MKGNYQGESPVMKFSPEAAGASSDAYQSQQYAIAHDDAEDTGQVKFEMVADADASTD